MLFLFHKMAECEFHSVYVAVRAKGASLRVGALVGLVVTYAPSSQDAPGSTTSLDVHCTLCCECDDCCCCCCSSSSRFGGAGNGKRPSNRLRMESDQNTTYEKDGSMDGLPCSLSLCVCVCIASPLSHHPVCLPLSSNETLTKLGQGGALAPTRGWQTNPILQVLTGEIGFQHRFNVSHISGPDKIANVLCVPIVKLHHGRFGRSRHIPCGILVGP